MGGWKISSNKEAKLSCACGVVGSPQSYGGDVVLESCLHWRMPIDQSHSAESARGVFVGCW